MAFGPELRAARERAGLSREGLRRRILKSFEDSPTVSGIRDLENGIASEPTGRNREKYLNALPKLRIS